ncbi:formate/nitrite transporter family protein [Edaphobacter paludis]|uniref:Formate/nitrite transporter family protein n=1 Tax=Edaphobacter paludis TaxID=3035702 RepID=A0AAU7CY73_9BACT
MPFRLRPHQPEPAAAPNEAQKNLERPSAQDIYEQVANNARQELGRSSVALAISGLAGGIFMGLSGLGNAIVIALLTTPGAAPTNATLFIAKMFYPLGFIVVILGRSQLFTENTLYPVALVLAEKKHFWKTMRLWGVVLPSNVLGALAFAAIAGLTGALRADMVSALAQLGVEALHHPAQTIFWSGVMGGWIIATVAWLVSGSHSITGSVMIIWMLAFVVGLGNFAHCIAASGEILTAVLTGHASLTAFLSWLGLAVAGNICGGVGMVTLLEYGQVIYGKDAESEALPPEPEAPTSTSVTK